MLHAGIQHKCHVGRHRGAERVRPGHQRRCRRRERGGPHRKPPLLHPHLNATLSTASLILSTITPASSVPCLPLNPFIAATIPTISNETSRIKPTYSTVPCPRSPPITVSIARIRRSIAACAKTISS